MPTPQQGGERGSSFLIFGEKTPRQFPSGRGASPPSASASPTPASTPSSGTSTSTPKTAHSWPHHRASTSSTRSSPQPEQHPTFSPVLTIRESTARPRKLGHPHGSPQMSHAIPSHLFQTLKSDRCNSNVFWAYRKLTKGNCMRVFGEDRLPPADEAGAGQADTRIVVAREPPGHNTPVTPVGAPNREPHPLHSRERPARRQRSYERSGEPCRPLTGRPWMGPCRRTRPHHETRARRRCRP